MSLPTRARRSPLQCRRCGGRFAVPVLPAGTDVIEEWACGTCGAPAEIPRRPPPLAPRYATPDPPSVPLAATLDWRLPGCGPFCSKNRHDPAAHEAHGEAHCRLCASRREVVGDLPRPDGLVRTDILTIDYDAVRILVRDEDVHVTPRERKVLLYLGARLGACCTHFELTAGAWSLERAQKWAEVDLDHRWHSLRMAVNRLKANLGEAGRLVEGVVGIGYRLIDLPPVVSSES